MCASYHRWPTALVHRSFLVRWTVEFDATDAQTINFQYPSTVPKIDYVPMPTLRSG
jgi:hypothetical protein